MEEHTNHHVPGTSTADCRDTPANCPSHTVNTVWLCTKITVSITPGYKYAEATSKSRQALREVAPTSIRPQLADTHITVKLDGFHVDATEQDLQVSEDMIYRRSLWQLYRAHSIYMKQMQPTIPSQQLRSKKSTDAL